jgi:hypothetical protein
MVISVVVSSPASVLRLRLGEHGALSRPASQLLRELFVVLFSASAGQAGGGSLDQERLRLYRHDQSHLATGLPRPCDARSPLYTGGPGGYPKTSNIGANLEHHLDHPTLLPPGYPEPIRPLQITHQSPSQGTIGHSSQFAWIFVPVPDQDKYEVNTGICEGRSPYLFPAASKSSSSVTRPS